jgi:hypothetical protein
MAETLNVNVCIYNEDVDCNVANCAHCGWNPEVAAKRTQAYKMAQLQAKFPGQKLYKIPFTGYCEVWARSPEDAVDQAGNEDMFFVHYEFEKPTCLTKEDDE